MSDDGDHGLSIILFIGSVFSPYYALARRRGNADPRNHVAINVALYGPAHRRWTMTERARTALTTTSHELQIGPSAARWADDRLVIEIDETAVPVPRRVRGRVVLHPEAVTERHFELDPGCRHRWWPIAPRARVEVELEQPRLAWRGHGYLDSNEGDEPVEAAFSTWSWSRAHLPDGSAALLYDPVFPDGGRRSLALRVDAKGGVEPFAAPQAARLPTSKWGIRRETRTERPDEVAILTTLEDTPFYARSMVATSLLGHAATAVHESLSATRYVSPVVKFMLPFRMPRRPG